MIVDYDKPIKRDSRHTPLWRLWESISPVLGWGALGWLMWQALALLEWRLKQ